MTFDVVEHFLLGDLFVGAEVLKAEDAYEVLHSTDKIFN